MNDKRRCVTLLAITDGREECLRRTLASFELCVNPAAINRRVIVNDSGDAAYSAWIDSLGFDEHIRPGRHRQGYPAAVNAGWAAIGEASHVFHLEDDFVFTRHVNVTEMVRVVDEHHLAQMALRRQAWNELEVAAGGVVEMHPDAYTDHHDRTCAWLTHRLFFTMNPCIYPRWIVEIGWPMVGGSEGVFSLNLFRDPAVRCGYWGSRSDEPWVLHIGDQRMGVGY